MTFQASIPNASDLISVSQTDLKNNFTALNTSWNVNHVGFNSSGAGKHKFLELVNQSGDPAGAITEMTLFSKTDGAGNSQVYYKRNSAGSSFQLTGRDPTGTTNGTTFLPGGFIMIWGFIAAATNGSTQTFPTPFPNNCFNVQVTINIGSTVSPVGINGFTNTGFTFRTTSGGGVPIVYIAIGN